MIKLETVPDTVKEVIKDRNIPLNKIKEIFGTNFRNFMKGKYIMNDSEIKKLAELTNIEYIFWKNLQNIDLKNNKCFNY